jgi:hypothetical protein
VGGRPHTERSGGQAKREISLVTTIAQSLNRCEMSF